MNNDMVSKTESDNIQARLAKDNLAYAFEMFYHSVDDRFESYPVHIGDALNHLRLKNKVQFLFCDTSGAITSREEVEIFITKLFHGFLKTVEKDNFRFVSIDAINAMWQITLGMP